MKTLKMLLFVVAAMVVVGLIPTNAFAAACGQAGTSAVSCTATLNVQATVQNAVSLQIVTDTGNSGCTLGGTATAATLALGNINGLGVGTAPTCAGGTITVTTNPAAPAVGTATTSATYTTKYILFAQVSGFATGAPAISAQITSDTGTATSGVALVEDDGGTAVGSAASITASSAAIANFSGTDAGTGVTANRLIGVKVNHANGANTSGSVNKTVTYTLTAS